jgi:hypothetical protein
MKYFNNILIILLLVVTLLLIKDLLDYNLINYGKFSNISLFDPLSNDDKVYHLNNIEPVIISKDNIKPSLQFKSDITKSRG